MSMTVARILSEELPTARELPMPPWLYGVIALVLFAFLLGVTWSFRGTAQKYAQPASHGGSPRPGTHRRGHRTRPPRGRRGALARSPRARPALSDSRMRLGVMGGTFDPIHHGHLVAASEVQSLLGLDEVVFVPTGEPWQKEGRDVAPAEHRYLMTVVATASNPRFTVSRVDIDRGGPTFTIDTLRDLQGPAPRRRAVLHHRRRRTGPDPVLEGLRRAVRARPVHRGHPTRLRAVRVGPARRPGRPDGGPRHGDQLHRLPRPGPRRRAGLVPRARRRRPVHLQAPPVCRDRTGRGP